MSDPRAILLLAALALAACLGPKLRYHRNRGLVDPTQENAPGVREAFDAGKEAYLGALKLCRADLLANPARFPAPNEDAGALFERARRFLIQAYDANPDTTLADKALFWAGECSLWLGRKGEAHDAYDRLLDHFADDQRGFHADPDRRRDLEIWNTVLAREFEYGRELITRAHDALLGDPDRGVAVLKRLVALDPYGTKTDDALFELGLHYEWAGDFQDAAQAYGTLLKDHQGSPLLPDALTRRALALITGARGVKYDPKPYLEAESHLEERSQRFDADLATSDALDRVRGQIVERAIAQARFYARRERYQSAVTVLDEILGHEKFKTAAEYNEALSLHEEYRGLMPPDGDTDRADEKTG